MKILITGASGFVGNRLIPKLIERGHSIVALGRDPDRLKKQLTLYSGADPKSDSIETAQWDALASNQRFISLLPIDAVIHLAGEPVLGFFRWTEEKKRTIRQSRIQGTQNLVELLTSQTTPPKVFISTSAVGFYGSRVDETLTEESSKGDGFLASVCEDWETEARKMNAPRTCIFRIGIVLGTEGGALKSMLTPFKFGLGGKIGSGKQWMSWIHIEDLTQMMVQAIENDSWNGVVNAVSPHPVQNSEFTETLARALHRPAPFPVPAFALRAALGEMAGETFLASQKVLPRRAAELGYAFQFKDLGSALKNLFPDKT